MKIYILLPDYDYEGFGTPEAAWNYKPSKEELMKYFKEKWYSGFTFDNQVLMKEIIRITDLLLTEGESRHWVLKELEMRVK